jgi:DNA-binding Lrp family transcriptional regulator
MEPLDPHDQALILALQAQPRARAVRLGELLGMSTPSVSNRLARLRERGALQVVGIIDYRALPSAYLAVALLRGFPVQHIGELAQRRGVVFAVHTVGSWDGAVCLIDRDAHAMETQIEWLRTMSSRVEVNAVLDMSVAGLPRHDLVAIRDDLDADIACLLAVDARASFTSIATALDIPEATARSRAQRLLDGHVVTPLVIPHPSLFGLTTAAAIGVEVSQPVEPIMDMVTALPGVIVSMRLQGRFAAVIEVLATDTAAVAALRDQVRAIDGVADVEVLGYGDRVVGRWPMPPHD